MPDLPSLPIYQTFASRRRMSLLSNDQRGRLRPQQIPRLAPIADSHDRAAQEARTTSDTETASPASDCPPVYDRSAELARYYRSVLPDSQAVWNEEGGDNKKETSDDASAEVEQLQRKTAQDSHCPLPLMHDDTRTEDGRDGGASLFGIHQELPSGPTHDAGHNTSSSLADQEPVSLSSTTPHSQPEDHPPDGSDNQWPIPAEENTVQDAPATTAEPIAELEAENVAPPIPPKHPKRLSRISQYGPVGLHVCTELLSEQLIEQLTKALSLQDKQRVGGSKPDDSTTEGGQTSQDQWESRKRLQILLLIESYEDLLKSCRKGGVLEKKMVPILEHWLESLQAVYDKAFSDGQEEG